MNGLVSAAAEVQNFCERNHWEFCFIGGLAVQRWGQSRVTLDVDVAILTGFGGEDPYINTLLKEFPPRINDAAEFARRSRILLIKTNRNVAVDVSFAALPFEELAIQRSSPWEVQTGTELRTCSAEDLIVMKLFASRPLDLRDAESVVLRQRQALDWKYIADQVTVLKEAREDIPMEDNLARLEMLR
jgi:hypothetical protein